MHSDYESGRHEGIEQIDVVGMGIVEVERGKVTRYAGSFDAYVREKAARHAQLEAAAQAQARRIRETERFIERFRAKASKATQAQSRIKALAREERIVVERDASQVRFRFPQPARTSAQVLALEGVAKSYGSKQVYAGVDFALRRGDKTVLVTGAGQGLGRAIGLAFAREGARVAFHYNSSAEGAEKAAAEAGAGGGQAIAVQADLGSTIRMSNNAFYDNKTGFACGTGGTLASANNNRKANNVGGVVPTCTPTVAITIQ